MKHLHVYDLSLMYYSQWLLYHFTYMMGATITMRGNPAESGYTQNRLQLEGRPSHVLPERKLD